MKTRRAFGSAFFFLRNITMNCLAASGRGIKTKPNKVLAASSGEFTVREIKRINGKNWNT